MFVIEEELKDGTKIFSQPLSNKLKATSQGKSTQIIMNVNSITTNSLNEYDIEPASYLNKYTMSELFTKMGTLLSRMN